MEQAADLKRQLLRRMATAGLAIVVLLAALPLVDYLAPSEDVIEGSPQFTEPVPVRKKDVLPPLQAGAATAAAPAVVTVIAGPQATGAALEATLPPASPAVAVAATDPIPGEPAVAASQPVAPAPRVLSGHRLQSGVLPDARRAEELQARLAEAGIPAQLETRLQVGPFRTRAEAEAAHRRMQALGIEAVVLGAKGGKP